MLNKQNISFNKREFVRYYGKTNKFHDYFTITASFSSREVKGDMHEVLTKGSFLTSPRLANDIKHFWLRWEVPAHILKKLKMVRKDHGIDFVVQHNDGTFSIGQCKFRSDKDNHTVKGDIDSFLAEYDLLNKKLIRNKYLVTTTQDVKDYLKQSDGLYVLAYSDLCDVVDMPKVLAWMEDRKLAYISRKRAKITIRATKAAVNHFAKYDKGNMLIFCGGRKTLTSLDISVLVALGATVARSKYGNKAKICFGVPSINLITQTLDVWAADLTARGVKFSYRIVCSDPSADQTDVVENMSVGAFDKDEASKWINDGANELKIVFTTFNSAEKAGELCEYDFTVVDEAHDTASRADSYKSYIVGDTFKSKKKLFQTATAKVINTTKEGYFSMDNEQQYGKCFCRIGYSELVKEGIILPLQLVLLSSEKYNNLSEELREEIENNVYYKDGLSNNIPAKDLRVVALLNIFMTDHKEATHFIAGYNSNKHAKEMADYMSKTMDPSIKIFNVDGLMTMRERKQILEEFENAERAIITNCRCLGVGVSINKVSGVVMGDPMKSKINISQFAGRASRLYNGKKFGFIIIPVESEHFLKGELESDEGYQTAVCLLATMIANDPWLKTIAMARWGNGKKNGKVSRVQKEIGADEEIFDMLVPNELKESVCYEHIKADVVRKLNRAGLWVEITKSDFIFYKKKEYTRNGIAREIGCNRVVVDKRCEEHFGTTYARWIGTGFSRMTDEESKKQLLHCKKNKMTIEKAMKYMDRCEDGIDTACKRLFNETYRAWTNTSKIVYSTITKKQIDDCAKKGMDTRTAAKHLNVHRSILDLASKKYYKKSYYQWSGNGGRIGETITKEMLLTFKKNKTHRDNVCKEIGCDIKCLDKKVKKLFGKTYTTWSNTGQVRGRITKETLIEARSLGLDRESAAKKNNTSGTTITSKCLKFFGKPYGQWSGVCLKPNQFSSK